MLLNLGGILVLTLEDLYWVGILV